MVTFDVGSIDRLGLLAPHASRADELIVVDHHASNTRFGTVQPDRPGGGRHGGARAGNLIGALGTELTREIAFGLYAGAGHGHGLISSTPRPRLRCMRWPPGCSTPESKPGAVARELWGPGSVSAISASCRAPSAGAELGTWAGRRPRPGMGTTVTRADRAALGLAPSRWPESVIDVVRRNRRGGRRGGPQGSPTTGCGQVSARSKGKVDVGRACTTLGGGGHRFAAGFTGSGTAAETMARLRPLLGEGG